MSKTDKNEPMDASVTEAKMGAPAKHTERVCYAAKTLAAEVTGLFPETPVRYSNYDGRNTALDVEFDLTAISADEDADALMRLLDALAGDIRIEQVIAEDDSVLVSFRSSARTQDSRETFGLAEAWSILTGDPDDEDADWPAGAAMFEDESL